MSDESVAPESQNQVKVSTYVTTQLVVGAVRAINGPFGANCSKAAKFGPDIDRTLLDRFWADPKKGISLRHRRGKSKMAATRYKKYQN